MKRFIDSKFLRQRRVQRIRSKLIPKESLKAPSKSPSVIAPWISAISALSLAALAIWAAFFSPASQALVGYLQSELAARNLRVTQLESRELELKLSTANLEKQITELSKQKSELQKQTDLLEKERAELSAGLSDAKSRLVKTRFANRYNEAVIVVTWPIYIIGRSNSKAQRFEVYSDYLRRAREIAATFENDDRKQADAIVQNFIARCGRYSKLVFDLPAGADLEATSAISDKGSKASQAVRDCLDKVMQE